LLGIGYETSFLNLAKELTKGYFSSANLINNMVQIGTGEGKSVTLAITSIILALLGIDVYCACYSS
jgi:hypothetical protein